MSFGKKLVLVAGFAAMGLLVGIGTGIVGAIMGALVMGAITTICIQIISRIVSLD